MKKPVRVVLKPEVACHAAEACGRLRRAAPPPRRQYTYVAKEANREDPKDKFIQFLVTETHFGNSLSRLYASLLIGAMLAEDEELHQRWQFLDKDYPPPPRDEAENRETRLTPQDMAALLLKNYRQILSEKEVDFLVNISKWPRQLSEKQIEWLERIVDRANRERMKRSRT